jgi:hypothetical protein
MFFIYHIKEKEDRRNKRSHTKKEILLLKIKYGVIERENKFTMGMIGSENCLQCMKRKRRTTLD